MLSHITTENNAGLLNGIKNLIEKIDNKPDEYGRDYIKIKLNSEDHLPVDDIYLLTIIVRSIFEENSDYYPQIYLNECLYDL